MNISLPDGTDDQGVHCVGAWPKGITVGNWREGGCAAQSLIRGALYRGHEADISRTTDAPRLFASARRTETK